MKKLPPKVKEALKTLKVFCKTEWERTDFSEGCSDCRIYGFCDAKNLPKDFDLAKLEDRKEDRKVVPSCAIQTSDVAACPSHVLGDDNEPYCTSKKPCECQRPIKFKRNKFGAKVYIGKVKL